MASISRTLRLNSLRRALIKKQAITEEIQHGLSQIAHSDTDIVVHVALDVSETALFRVAAINSLGEVCSRSAIVALSTLADDSSFSSAVEIALRKNPHADAQRVIDALELRREFRDDDIVILVLRRNGADPMGIPRFYSIGLNAERIKLSRLQSAVQLHVVGKHQEPVGLRLTDLTLVSPKFMPSERESIEAAAENVIPIGLNFSSAHIPVLPRFVRSGESIAKPCKMIVNVSLRIRNYSDLPDFQCKINRDYIRFPFENFKHLYFSESHSTDLAQSREFLIAAAQRLPVGIGTWIPLCFLAHGRVIHGALHLMSSLGSTLYSAELYLDDLLDVGEGFSLRRNVFWESMDGACENSLDTEIAVVTRAFSLEIV